MPSRVPSFAADLAVHGDAIALVDGTGGTTTYHELADRADAVAASLGATRRLILLAGSTTAGSITAYLGALRGGHVVLLAPGDHPAAVEALIDAYDPDVVIEPPVDGDVGAPAPIRERHPGTRHRLHADLALLMSTSGSTGSPKLVRLSTENLDSNAAAIVEVLGIRAEDRAATTLPMHYTYGLSVIHTHLLAGASLLVTDRSVVEPGFWTAFRAAGASTLAGVPYTFELLDRAGFADLDLPTLRSVTQAGGRLDPERVRVYAELGRQRGWSFTVMYGQTEATARMAVLPAELALVHPETIGRAIPGGSLTVVPVEGGLDGVGELVYRGPNVMLGYAEAPADLALGRTVDELRTGDLGRQLRDGLFQVTGRRSSFVKVAGVRIDVEHVERRLHGMGIQAWLACADGQLVAALEGDGDPSVIAAHIVRLAAVPPRLVEVLRVAAVPRLASGKPDRPGIQALATTLFPTPAGPAVPTPTDPLTAIQALYTEATGRPAGASDTFVGLGGDSLSYVHVSLGLEDILGRLPGAWPTMSIRDLAAVASPADPAPRRSRWPGALTLRWVEMTVLLRAMAILCIVAQHSGLAYILGGAHVLVAVAGFNFARFQLTPAARLDRLRSQARAIARIALPAIVWIGLMLIVTDDYGPQNLILANAILGPDRFDTTWHFWFIEMLLYVLVAMAALLAIPAVDRFERRWPFTLAAVVLGVGLLFRYGILDHDLTNPRPILWLFALGWAAGKATTWWQRIAVAAVAIWAVPGFFGDAQRELLITGGIVALIAIRRLPVPRPLAPVAGILASASLYIYLVHWQVWTNLPEVPRDLVFGLCLGAGLAAWLVAGQAGTAVARARDLWSRRRLPQDRRVRPELLAPG